jgi:serine/threonine-protein kinase HipA
LSPAYDLNPVPTDIKPRILTTAIDLEDTTASLKLALQWRRILSFVPKTRVPLPRRLAGGCHMAKGR